jgi:hypothetical protein
MAVPQINPIKTALRDMIHRMTCQQGLFPLMQIFRV